LKRYEDPLAESWKNASFLSLSLSLSFPVSDKCNIKTFADDALVYVSGKSSKKLEFKMNIALKAVERWMCVKIEDECRKNQMHDRGMRREQKDDVILKRSDGTLIERVQRIKYLGIIVDDTLLTWGSLLFA